MFLFKTLLILFFSFSAQAMNQKIEIDSKLFFNGKKIGSPRILAVDGEKSKIIMNDLKQNREYNLEVLPQIGRDKKVNLKYRLAIKGQKNETISRGSISIKDNKNGRIYLDHGRIQIHLKIKKS